MTNGTCKKSSGNNSRDTILEQVHYRRSLGRVNVHFTGDKGALFGGCRDIHHIRLHDGAALMPKCVRIEPQLTLVTVKELVMDARLPIAHVERRILVDLGDIHNSGDDA